MIGKVEGFHLCSCGDERNRLHYYTYPWKHEFAVTERRNVLNSRAVTQRPGRGDRTRSEREKTMSTLDTVGKTGTAGIDRAGPARSALPTRCACARSCGCCAWRGLTVALAGMQPHGPDRPCDPRIASARQTPLTDSVKADARLLPITNERRIRFTCAPMWIGVASMAWSPLLQGRDLTTGGYVDTYMILYDQNGTLVRANDDIDTLLPGRSAVLRFEHHSCRPSRERPYHSMCGHDLSSVSCRLSLVPLS